MLSTEVREIMVKAYEKSHNATEVARNFSVSRSTVYDHVNRMRETGSVAVQTSKRGCKPILSQQQLEEIAETITNQPDISIHEIKEKLALPVSEENIREKVVQAKILSTRFTENGATTANGTVLTILDWLLRKPPTAYRFLLT